MAAVKILVRKKSDHIDHGHRLHREIVILRLAEMRRRVGH